MHPRFCKNVNSEETEMKQRIGTMFLCLCLILTVIPLPAFAAGEIAEDSGVPGDDTRCPDTLKTACCTKKEAFPPIRNHASYSVGVTGFAKRL